MPRLRRTLTVASALIAASLGSSTAHAQFFDSPGQDFAVTPAAPVVTSAPVVASTRALTRQDRRAARRQARYETLRPNYGWGNNGITFAPFSDRYYPRTVYSRDVPPRATTTVFPR